MVNEMFSINLEESDGVRVWEMDDIPQPNTVYQGTARYNGQKNVENLIKVINQRAFIDHEDRFIDPFFSIFERSLEQGVEDEGIIQWDDRSHFTRISWTNYTWKLPPEIKRRMVQIDISKRGENESVGKIRIPLSKIANDGCDILISSRIITKLNLKNGIAVNVKMRFYHKNRMIDQ